ncbi:hypothetical protein [Paraburkholderia sp. J67]|uniref:hypothetical protein n=1 Tax=Paraburkholderia sp. J67 TaxID=2805435 RepID=UPI002ABD6AD8|nr:hypothetical protein [Paraburkholderia sp. J67]
MQQTHGLLKTKNARQRAKRNPCGSQDVMTQRTRGQLNAPWFATEGLIDCVDCTFVTERNRRIRCSAGDGLNKTMLQFFYGSSEEDRMRRFAEQRGNAPSGDPLIAHQGGWYAEARPTPSDTKPNANADHTWANCEISPGISGARERKPHSGHS